MIAKKKTLIFSPLSKSSLQSSLQKRQLSFWNCLQVQAGYHSTCKDEIAKNQINNKSLIAVWFATIPTMARAYLAFRWHFQMIFRYFVNEISLFFNNLNHVSLLNRLRKPQLRYRISLQAQEVFSLCFLIRYTVIHLFTKFFFASLFANNRN